MKKHIGLYFGTFNPIHVGHLIIANHIVEFSNLDEVWFVVSPQNPHKEKKSILADFHRLALVDIALEDNDKLKSSNIEFSLPKPSYTVTTLTYIKEKYPEYNFSLIMGEDNLNSLHRWKNYEEILSNHSIMVYPRVMMEGEQMEKKPSSEVLEKGQIEFFDAPVMKISASHIRNSIKAEKDVRYLIPPKVHRYLEEMRFYK